MYINYSLGIGVGMVLCGTLYYGATGAAGEISLLGLKASRRQPDHPMLRLVNHLLTVMPRGPIGNVATLAAHGDATAQGALSAFNTELANYLAIVASVIDPAVLVLQDVPHVAEPLKEEVQLALEDVGLQTRVIITPLGSLAGLDSAA